MINLGKKIELIANVAIIIVACLLATALVKIYLSAKPAEPEVRKQLDSPPTASSLNINWGQHRQTLILAVSSTCQFCSESAPFYRKLVQK